MNDVVSVKEFFDAGPSEGDIGCNLVPHPGISAFASALTAISRRPDVIGVFVELTDTGESGLGYTNTVWVGGNVPADAALPVAEMLMAEMLEADELELPSGLPALPIGNHWFAFFWD